MEGWLMPKKPSQKQRLGWSRKSLNLNELRARARPASVTH